jgi:hypothetical protein
VAMQARLEDEELGDTSRVNFLFALAKAYEDRSDYERAWDYYATGNATQRVREYYDPVQTEFINDAIIDVFDAELLADKSGGGDPDRAPIFIVDIAVPRDVDVEVGIGLVEIVKGDPLQSVQAVDQDLVDARFFESRVREEHENAVCRITYGSSHRFDHVAL